MVDEQWQQWYQTLGLTPGIQDWALVKKRYHELIRTSHPDRFSTTDPQRQIAEERSKRIISAYRQLSRYYRRVGTLPTVDVLVQEVDLPPTSPRVPNSPPPTHSFYAAAKVKSRSRRRFVTVLTLSGLLIATYVAVNRYQALNTTPELGADPKSFAVTHDFSDLDPFTFGASPGAVYASQGVPTRIDGNIWFYGLSEVHFDNGQVVSWNEHPNNPLNVSLQNNEDDSE